MKISKIKSRSTIFSKSVKNEWDLNIHVIQGDKYNYLIDTGLGSLHMEPVLEFLKKDKKEVVVINTHYHWDHIWGNHLFPNSMIISHRKCRELMNKEWDNMILKNQKYVEGVAVKYLPSLTFDTEIYFPEDKIRIFYTPGHTADSISILDEVDRILDAGDNIGDTVDEIVPNLACDIETYRKSLLEYQKYDFDTVISGHNIVLDKGVIERILGLI